MKNAQNGFNLKKDLLLYLVQPESFHFAWWRCLLIVLCCVLWQEWVFVRVHDHHIPHYGVILPFGVQLSQVAPLQQSVCELWLPFWKQLHKICIKIICYVPIQAATLQQCTILWITVEKNCLRIRWLCGPAEVWEKKYREQWTHSEFAKLWQSESDGPESWIPLNQSRKATYFCVRCYTSINQRECYMLWCTPSMPKHSHLQGMDRINSWIKYWRIKFLRQCKFRSGQKARFN